MIELSSTWTLRRDSYQWILDRHYQSTPKPGGVPTMTTAQTYHATMAQAAEYIATFSAGELLDDPAVRSASDIVAALQALSGEILKSVRARVGKRGQE